MTESTLHQRYPATHDWFVEPATRWVCTVCGCEIWWPTDENGYLNPGSTTVVVPPCRGSAKVEITAASAEARALLGGPG